MELGEDVNHSVDCKTFGRAIVGRGILDHLLDVKEMRWILLLFFFSLALRFLWISVSPAIPTSDAAFYDDAAVGIANGQGYIMDGHPSAYWPVGYPAFLASIYLLFGHHLVAVKIIQAILSALTVVLVYKMSSLLFDELSSRFSGFLLAFSLNNTSYAAVLMSEILFSFLFMGAVYVFLKLRKGGYEPLHYSSVGILLALACYVRPLPLLLPPFLFGYDLLTGQNRPQTLRQYAFLVSFMVLTVLPWTIRNWNVLGQPAIISTNGGINFLIGNNPNATGKYVWPVANERFQYAWENEKEVLREKVAYEEAVRFIKDNPMTFSLLTVKRLFFLLYADWDGIYENSRKTSFPISNGLRYLLYFLCQSYYIFSMTVFCLAMTQRTSWTRVKGLLTVILIYWVAVHMIIVAEPRYHFPIVPIFYMFGASYLAGRVRWLTKKQALSPLQVTV